MEEEFVVVILCLQEEARSWDVNDLVFTPGLWGMYQPLLRADFRIFDEYRPSYRQATLQQAQQPFEFPITAFWGSQDRKVKKHMVQVSGARGGAGGARGRQAVRAEGQTRGGAKVAGGPLLRVEQALGTRDPCP